MGEVNYKQVVCLLMSDGYVTLEQVQNAVARATPSKEEKPRDTPTWRLAEVLCERLNKGIVANDHRPFRMNFTNMQPMEKLLRIDKADPDEVQTMVDWCVSHEFWGTVIFSPVKFRKHYNTMLARRQYEARKPGEPTTYNPSAKLQSVDEDFIAQKERERREAVPMPKGFKDSLRMAR